MSKSIKLPPVKLRIPCFKPLLSYNRGYKKVTASLPKLSSSAPTLLEVIREHKYNLLLMYQDSNSCNAYSAGMAAAILNVEVNNSDYKLAKAKTKHSHNISGARAGGASPRDGKGYSDTDYKVHFPSLKEDSHG